MRLCGGMKSSYTCSIIAGVCVCVDGVGGTPGVEPGNETMQWYK